MSIMVALGARTASQSRRPRLGGILLTAVFLFAAEPTRAAGPGKVDFARQIRPILAESCFECHGPDPRGRKADLRLDSRADVFADRGGYHLVVPGRPEESELIARIFSEDPDELMPPTTSRRRLTRAQAELLQRWVAEGASWSEHWAFVPPRRSEIPQVSRPGWCRNPIDRLVLARLDRAGLRPSPEADRVTLIRRLSLDLLGLPLTPSEVDQFLTDNRPGAYERLVDRLLASPQFGERWARPWLDLVRYADSDGYEDDRYRPDAWRYRDWVIDAFNRDMPFDRFTIEQLAGDLLPGATLERSDRRRLPSHDDVQPNGGREGQRGGVPRQDGQGPRQHHGHGLAGADVRLRRVPHAQVRPDPPARLLSVLRLLQQPGRHPGPCATAQRRAAPNLQGDGARIRGRAGDGEGATETLRDDQAPLATGRLGAFRRSQ